MNRELVKESISQFEVAIDNLKQSLLEEDKFAELKEAHKNGAIIQTRIARTNTWVDNPRPTWSEVCEYRIKPEEKPKAGDVCKFWDTCENDSFIAKLHSISEGEFPYTVYPGYSDFMNAKPLTQQEVIDLLFK